MASEGKPPVGESKPAEVRSEYRVSGTLAADGRPWASGAFSVESVARRVMADWRSERTRGYLRDLRIEQRQVIESKWRPVDGEGHDSATEEGGEQRG